MPDVNELILAQQDAIAALRDEVRRSATETKRNGEAHSLTTEAIAKIQKSLDSLESKTEVLAAEAEQDKLWRARADDTICRIQAPGFVVNSTADAHTKAFAHFLRTRGDTAELKALSGVTGEGGGFLVPGPMAAAVREKAAPLVPMRTLATVETLNVGNSISVPIEGDDPALTWTAEQTTRSETSGGTWNGVSIQAHEAYALVKVPMSLIEDSGSDIEAHITRRLAKKIGQGENAKFTTGNGISGPKGILTGTYGTTAAHGTVCHVASGGAGAFASSTPYVNVTNLIESIPTAYQAGAVFQAAKTVRSGLRTMNDGAGKFFWEPASGQSAQPRFMDYPVFENGDLPALGANSYSLAFGNFAEAYTILDRVGITVLPNPYSAPGFVLFYFRIRVGGAVVNYEAYSVMKFAASV